MHSHPWCVFLDGSDHGREAVMRSYCTIMFVSDLRHLSRPACCDGSVERRYDEWRSQLVASLTAVDPRFTDVAEEVARTTAPFVLADTTKARKLTLCCTRSSWVASSTDHDD